MHVNNAKRLFCRHAHLRQYRLPASWRYWCGFPGKWGLSARTSVPLSLWNERLLWGTQGNKQLRLTQFHLFIYSFQTLIHVLYSSYNTNAWEVTQKGCPVEPSHHLHACRHRSPFSILTATVIVESALASPYAVASTTFPNAPDPNVFPEDMTDRKLLFAILFPLPQRGPMPAFLGQQQSYPEGWVHRHQDTQDPVLGGL